MIKMSMEVYKQIQVYKRPNILKRFLNIFLKAFNKKQYLLVLKSDTGVVPCESLLIQFMELLEICLRRVNGMNVTDVTNTEIVVEAPGNQAIQKYFFYGDAQEGDDTFGILVGTGVGAESNTNYVIGTQIAHGTGGGELEYQGTAFTEPYVIGGNVDGQIRRSFHNDSGGPITIEEIVLVVKASDGGAEDLFTIIRDLNNQAVADNETAVVKFTFRTTV